MAAGREVTMADLNSQIGSQAFNAVVLERELRALKSYVDSTTQEALVAMGYTTDEAYLIKLAYETEAATLLACLEGMVQMRKLAGTGVTAQPLLR